jgi:hypothetical protein
MVTVTFKFPLKCSVQQVKFRETNGKDEALAAVKAKALGDQGSTTDELVRLSIMEVDGQQVQQPYGDYDGWNTRTRALALAAWRSLNGFDDVEAADFLRQAVPATAP